MCNSWQKMNQLVVLTGCHLHGPKPPFQSEAKYEAIVLKMISYSHENNTHFH